MGNAGINMSWKKKLRRMAAKVAPAKMNTKNKNEDWKNTKDKKPLKASGKELKKEADWEKWLDSKRKERDREPTSRRERGAGKRKLGVLRSMCAMCKKRLPPQLRIQDPLTGLNYCKECARNKGLIE